MVLGLAYIFFFNPTTFTIPLTGIELANPFSFLYANDGHPGDLHHRALLHGAASDGVDRA